MARHGRRVEVEQVAIARQEHVRAGRGAAFEQVIVPRIAAHGDAVTGFDHPGIGHEGGDGRDEAPHLLRRDLALVAQGRGRVPVFAQQLGGDDNGRLAGNLAEGGLRDTAEGEGRD